MINRLKTGATGGKKDRVALLSGNLVCVRDPKGEGSEAYRMLRTNLLYAGVDSPSKVIAVTSAGSREGKSTTCANLGVSLAQAGKSVLLLDCDLRRPSQHDIFWLRGKSGLIDTLAGERTLPEVWHEPVPGLKVAPAGHVPPNATEILNSWRFAELLAWARQEFDYVLLDTPPASLVSDAAVLSRHGDGVLLVLDASEASKKSLRHAMRVLDGVGANVIGTVMNRVRTRKKDGYGYGYGYRGGA